MTITELRSLWTTEPFRPMTIHMVDGKSVKVPHPEYLFFFPHGNMVMVVGEREGGPMRFITADQIASVER